MKNAYIRCSERVCGGSSTKFIIGDMMSPKEAMPPMIRSPD